MSQKPEKPKLTPTQEKIWTIYRPHLKEKYKSRLKEELLKAGVVPLNNKIPS
jgi:hypothetical protein